MHLLHKEGCINLLELKYGNIFIMANVMFINICHWMRQIVPPFAVRGVLCHKIYFLQTAFQPQVKRNCVCQTTNDAYFSLSGGITTPWNYCRVTITVIKHLIWAGNFNYPLRKVLLSYNLIMLQTSSLFCPFAWEVHSSTHIFTYTITEHKFLQ